MKDTAGIIAAIIEASLLAVFGIAYAVAENAKKEGLEIQATENPKPENAIQENSS